MPLRRLRHWRRCRDGDCLTDNKTRTVADVRHAFSKYGGNMGTDGCVAFQFTHCGYLVFAPGTDEDALMEKALEVGADDVVSNDDGSLEVITPPYEFTRIKGELEAAGFKSEMGEVTMRPQTKACWPVTTLCVCKSCWTRWKTWTTCKRYIPRPYWKIDAGSASA